MLDEQLYLKAKKFISYSNVYYIDNEIVDKTIEIRQKHKRKLPDAVIGATAIVNELVLVTKNTNDFKNIGADLFESKIGKI